MALTLEEKETVVKQTNAALWRQWVTTEILPKGRDLASTFQDELLRGDEPGMEACTYNLMVTKFKVILHGGLKLA